MFPSVTLTLFFEGFAYIQYNGMSTGGYLLDIDQSCLQDVRLYHYSNCDRESSMTDWQMYRYRPPTCHARYYCTLQCIESSMTDWQMYRYRPHSLLLYSAARCIERHHTSVATLYVYSTLELRTKYRHLYRYRPHTHYFWTLQLEPPYR